MVSDVGIPKANSPAPSEDRAGLMMRARPLASHPGLANAFFGAIA